jgi:hypothetical protein
VNQFQTEYHSLTLGITASFRDKFVGRHVTDDGPCGLRYVRPCKLWDSISIHVTRNTTYRSAAYETVALMKKNQIFYIVEPGYNDIGLCDTLFIASDIVWY